MMIKLSTLATLLLSLHLSTPSAQAHCQIPCGIYDDKAELDKLKLHAKTIEKSVQEMSKTKGGDQQFVRWTMNKEDHAKMIQDSVLQYFLAQRIKLPDGNQAAAKTYQKKLSLAHEVIVHAMKAKQNGSADHAKKLSATVNQFVDYMTKNHH